MDLPERRVGRVHDEPAQMVFSVLGGRRRADQILTSLGHFRFRLNEIDRGRLSEIDA